ncbi:MAG TPA: glycosyltransferase, partial [Chthoniobacterales bacterium]
MSPPATAALRLSVIIPSWKDHANLVRSVPVLIALHALHEVIVVDASPDPATAEAMTTAGAMYLRATQPNRGAQMNLAAESATGDVLIFHHADSIINAAHVAAIHETLRDPGVIGGAFYRKFDARHPRLLWLETVGRFMARHGGSFFG